jgi:hypothetical protein
MFRHPGPSSGCNLMALEAETCSCYYYYITIVIIIYIVHRSYDDSILTHIYR